MKEFSKRSNANFKIGCPNASASIALTQLLMSPLELYSEKSLLMCFLYLFKKMSCANIGGGRLLVCYLPRINVDFICLFYLNPSFGNLKVTYETLLARLLRCLYIIIALLLHCVT